MKLSHILLFSLIYSGVMNNMSASENNWVSTWVSAQQIIESGNMPPAPGLSNNTLRQVVHVSIGGKTLRIRLSNQYGTTPVFIKGANVAISEGNDKIKTGTGKKLTLSGASTFSIPSGATIYSDPVDFDLLPLSNLTVTIYFDETPPTITGHPGSRTTSYIEEGNAVTKTKLPNAIKTEHWYILSGVEVLSQKPGKAAVIFGDSITDGRGSTTDGNNRWTDNLARRFRENPSTSDIAVLNQGIGGNAVLKGGLGPTAIERFERDVLGVNGVRWLVIFIGVNDIGGNFGADKKEVAANLIKALKMFIKKAHEKNIKVYGVPILPFGGSHYGREANEAARKTVNEWIRTSGMYDAVIDFDAVVRNPNHPDYLDSDCDSGDNLHPGVTGYRKMADAVDLKLFE